MKESLKILIPSLFVDLRLNRIEAATLEENVASRNLLKKLGFKKEGLLRNYLKINGVWRDHVLYGLLKKDINTDFQLGGLQSHPNPAPKQSQNQLRHDSFHGTSYL